MYIRVAPRAPSSPSPSRAAAAAAVGPISSLSLSTRVASSGLARTSNGSSSQKHYCRLAADHRRGCGRLRRSRRHFCCCNVGASLVVNPLPAIVILSRPTPPFQVRKNTSSARSTPPATHSSHLITVSVAAALVNTHTLTSHNLISSMTTAPTKQPKPQQQKQ